MKNQPGKNTKGLKRTAGPGRPKGARNKFSLNLRDQILSIADDLDKRKKGLKDCAEGNPQWFLENFLKPMIPKDIKLDIGGEFAEALKVIQERRIGAKSAEDS